MFDETLDGRRDLIRCDEGPASNVDGFELLDIDAFCSEVSGRKAGFDVNGREPSPKILRNASAGGAMDEDVLARAEIEVPGLEILEGPAMEDEVFEVVGCTLCTAIIFSALDNYKTSSIDAPGAETLPTRSLISGSLSLRRFGAVPMSQPPSFLLRG